MAVCSKHHKELDMNGIGKCSVPMWAGGMPAGFCDKPAYGFPLPHETVRDYHGRKIRTDGSYNGYVPFLACPLHGGPENQRKIMTEQDMEKDILILMLRLIGEDPDTFSPEVLEVMKRWKSKAYAVLQGNHIYEL